MINIKDVGLKPYEGAKPQKEKTIIQTLLIIIEFSFKFLTVVVLSVPIYYKLLKDIISPPRRKNIGGQLALVTGGANGLGREICLCLAKRGCNVAVVDLDLENAEKTASNCRQFHIKAKGYRVDVSNYNEIRDLRKQIEEDLGPVDILINNAGILAALSLREGAPEDIDRIIRVNLTAQFYVSVLDYSLVRKKELSKILFRISLLIIPFNPPATVYLIAR